MEHRASQRTSQELRQRLRIDPTVVLASKLLRLQQHELEAAIEQELQDNPALERLETEPEEWQQDAVRYLSGERRTYQTHEDDPAADWTEFVAAAPSLHDHLWAQMSVRVAKQDLPLARIIVDAVDENGYLGLPPEEIANMAAADLHHVEQLVATLKTCDPPGVGALDLQECLSLQLIDAEDRIGLVAMAIVNNNWSDLVGKRFGAIARRYKLSEDEVEEAVSRIVALSPHPGEAFVRESERVMSSNRTLAMAPDVVYHRTQSGIEINILGPEPREFYIDEAYRERLRIIRTNTAKVDRQEARHISEYVGRAATFMRALRQRKSSLRKIAVCLLKTHYAFISTGSIEFLTPLTRLQIARAANLHESTVSRATMGKHVQIATGEVIPFECFFKPALRVQKMIEEMLLSENPDAPLSDREISESLAQRGVFVARRTVSKHREALRLLSSHKRKSA